jgi:hypothetical protein
VNEGPNNGLHPRHPGRGSSTHLIAAEGVNGEAEVGGFLIFFPSGATKQVGWRQATPITPTLEASKQFASKVIESLMKDGLQTDIDGTNWVSVTAAIQRVILDWNSVMQVRIGAEMAKRFGGDPTGLVH